MTARARSLLTEWAKWLLLPAFGVAFSFGAFGSTIRGDLRAIDTRVETNRRHAEQSLSNAIEIRKRDQALLEQSIKEIIPALRALADGQKQFSDSQNKANEAIARLEVTVSFMAKSQEEIKAQLNSQKK